MPINTNKGISTRKNQRKGGLHDLYRFQNTLRVLGEVPIPHASNNRLLELYPDPPAIADMDHPLLGLEV